jgi:hypothetical protein
MATNQDKHNAAERVSVVALDGDLEWLLMCGAAAMGERGTTGGVINAIESGGGGSGRLGEDGSYIHAYTDQQLGTGSFGAGDVERHRWLNGAWLSLPERTRYILQRCYLAPRSDLRSDAGYGARDRWIKEQDFRSGSHPQHRTNVEAQLGEYARLAADLCADAAYLAVACFEPEPLHLSGAREGQVNREESKRRRRAVRTALKLAQQASVQAHEQWAAAKASAAPMRATRERRALLTPHLAAEAAE